MIIQSLSFLLFLLINLSKSQEILITEPVDNDDISIKPTNLTNDEQSRVLYDQRQTGKYNIHLSIKDVAIIEMNQRQNEDDFYDNADYYYDEADLTVKPLSLTTPQSSTILKSSTKISTTSTENNAFKTTDDYLQSTTLNADNSATDPVTIFNIPKRATPIKENRANSDTLESRIYKFKMQKQQPIKHKLLQQLPYPLPLHHLNAQRCRNNQFRDISGNCQNRRVASNLTPTSILRKFFNMLVSLPISSFHEKENNSN